MSAPESALRACGRFSVTTPTFSCLETSTRDMVGRERAKTVV